jgi:hypothetical protein
VVRLVIDERKPVDDRGNAGRSGPYELIRGRLFGEVDPRNAGNRIIQDIALAPRNARGKVEYVATFTLLRPIEAAKDAGVLINAVPNRGGRGVASWGFLPGLVDPMFYDRGWSTLWVGWQGDLAEKPSRETSAASLKMESLLVPRARQANGKPLVGPYLMRIPAVAGEGPSGEYMKLGQGGAGQLSYMPASFDTRRAELTGGPPEDIRGRPTGPRYTLAPGDWTWWNCKTKAAPMATDAAGDLCVRRLNGSFDPEQSYLLTFNVRDPLVLGLGFAAMRDANAFFRYEAEDRDGTANPVAGRLKLVVSQGVSQVGNFVKTFIALGFNADERGRRVWDAAHSHIAGRRTPVNYRFATPGSSASLYMPGSEGVLWWGRARNVVRGGRPVSMLDRCTAGDTCPKIFETFGGAELWNQRMAAGMVSLDLQHDIPLPDNVRRYYFPGTQHGGGPGGFRLSSQDPREATSGCTLPLNPNPQSDQMRALAVALVEWVGSGKEPPASVYPTLANGKLVRDERGTLRFPQLPGIPSPYGLANPLLIYDYGPQFNYVDMSGVITRQPPAIRAVVPSLVAQVDLDGNETSGAPSVQHMAPLGSYLSWNTYKSGPYAGQICSFNAGWVPFAKTATERTAVADPRASIEERYRTRAGYLAAVREAVAKAEADGFLLAADGERLIREASEATESGDLSFLKP